MSEPRIGVEGHADFVAVPDEAFAKRVPSVKADSESGDRTRPRLKSRLSRKTVVEFERVPEHLF